MEELIMAAIVLVLCAIVVIALYDELNKWGE